MTEQIAVYESQHTAQQIEDAMGAVLSIGENGNWWIGDNDTGVFAGGVDRVLLAEFNVEEDVSKLVVPLADDAYDFSSIMIFATIKDNAQLEVHLRNIEANKNLVQIFHENGQVGASNFSRLVCQVDFYRDYFVSTFSILGTYQWQTTNKYTFARPCNKDYAANGLEFGGTIFAGSTIVVEGIR